MDGDEGWYTGTTVSPTTGRDVVCVGASLVEDDDVDCDDDGEAEAGDDGKDEERRTFQVAAYDAVTLLLSLWRNHWPYDDNDANDDQLLVYDNDGIAIHLDCIAVIACVRATDAAAVGHFAAARPIHFIVLIGAFNYTRLIV